MAVWSSFRKLLSSNLQNNIKSSIKNQHVNFSVNSVMRSGHGGPKTFDITPSRFQWHKFKDMLHFYVMVGAIPISVIVFYINVFIGPAKLQPIPEDYTPKHWEYYPHPITRFIARYIYPNPQQEYEKFMHCIYEEKDKMNIRRLEREIRAKMAERQDYQAYYYKHLDGKFLRRYKTFNEVQEGYLGDNDP